MGDSARRKRHVSATERAAYRPPDLGTLPDAMTTEAVWKLVEPRLPAPLKALVPDLTAKQAFLVVLDQCMRVGEEPKYQETRDGKHDRGKRRMLTRNHVFEALALKWSPTFQEISEKGVPRLGLVPTKYVRNMRLDAFEMIRREILISGVRIAALWKIIVSSGWSNSDRAKKPGANPLFSLRRLPKSGYRVTLRKTNELREFRQLVPAAPTGRRRLLLDSDPWPARDPRYEICAERPFDVVESEQRARDLLDAVERTRLLFDVLAFKADYKRWRRIVWKIRRWQRLDEAGLSYEERRRRFPRRLEIAQRAQIDLDAHREVYQQVQASPGLIQGRYLLIKSRFFRAVNRRFHAANFWPEHVSTRLDHSTRIPGSGFILRISQRDRWFAFPAPDLPSGAGILEGYDVSASGTMILAILLGLRDLEHLAGLRAEKKFTLYLAEQAMERLPLRPVYTNAAELVPLIKDLWTRVIYGGRRKEIVWDHFDLVPGSFTKYEYLDAVKATKKNPNDKQAGKRVKKYRDALKTAEQNIETFLESLPWYGTKGEGKLGDFFRACQTARTGRPHKYVDTRGHVRWRWDRYEGIVFTDPYDGAKIRWNPVRSSTDQRSSHGFKISLDRPGGWRGWKDLTGRKRRQFQAAPANPAGDYPVDASRLRRDLAPYIVHTLDACFSALVMERLVKQEMPFVALHDCWYLPAMIQKPNAPGFGLGLERLRAVIEDAAPEWVSRLGPIYDGLLTYLKGTEFEAFARRIKRRWRERLSSGVPVEFRVDETELSRLSVKGPHNGEETEDLREPEIFGLGDR